MNYDLFNQPAETFWTNTVHKTERSSYGQTFLDKSRKRLGGQNKRVYEYLIQGNDIDDDVARSWNPEIRHLHSRIADLGGFGFDIDRKPHPTKNITTYFMTPEQIHYNKKLHTNLIDGRK